MNSSRTPDPSWRSAGRKPAPVLGSLIAEANQMPATGSRYGTLVPPSIAELPARATIAPRDLSEGDLARMTYAWGHAFPPDAEPRHTLKGVTPAATSDRQLKTRSTGPEETAVGNEPTPHRVPLRDVVGPKATRDGSADYELLDVIGEGGVGIVYEARQNSIDRTVAVKMLRSVSNEADRSYRNKFLAEAVITGDLEHPNIVPVYDLALSSDDAVFYSMKRVQGTPWNEVLAKRSIRENLEVLMRVADALAFAHSRGVIHRDLKPENVMLGDFGEVLVMDWGIAVATSQFRKADQVAVTGGLGGTPAYMAPEMVTGPSEKIDFRSDVYLLGAILFEIVTGLPPHPGDDAMECLYAAARNEILDVEEAGELIQVAYQALSTKPDDRFESVAEFQAAVREYLSHSDAIALADQASRDLAAAQTSKDYRDFARSVFGFEESIALWPGNISAVEGLARAREGYALAALERDDFDLGISQLDERDPQHATLLRKLRAGQTERNQRRQRLKNARRLVGALVLLVFAVVTGALGVVWKKQSELAAVNTELESTNEDLREQEGTVRNQRDRLEAQKGELVEKQGQLETALAEVTDERNAADSARKSESAAKDRAFELQDITDKTAYNAVIGLAAEKIEENSFSEANRLLDGYASSPLRHWEWGRLKYLCEQAHEVADVGSAVEALAVNATGDQFVSATGSGLLQLWETQSLKPQKQIELDIAAKALAISPSGDAVVAGCQDGHLRAWKMSDPGEMTLLWDRAAHEKEITSLAFTKDGRFLISGSKDHSALVSDAGSGEALLTLEGHSWWVNAVAIISTTQSSIRIATAGQDCRVVLWEIKSEGRNLSIQSTEEFLWHQDPVRALAVTHDGARIATAGRDGRIFVWNPNDFARIRLKDRVEGKPDPTPTHVVLTGHSAAVSSLSFEGGNARRSRLLSGSDDNTLRLWDLETNRTIVTLRGHGSRVTACLFPPAISAIGNRVLSGSLDGQIHLYDVDGYAESRVVQGDRFRGHEDAILSAAFDATGRRIVTASRDRTARVVDLTTGQTTVLDEGHAFLAARATFLPNSARLVTAAMDGSVRIWEIATGGELAMINGTGSQAIVAASSDEHWLVTGGTGNEVQLWEIARIIGEVSPSPQPLVGLSEPLSAVAFSTDSRFVLTGDQGGHLWLWETASQKLVRKLDGNARRPGHRREITAIKFLPDDVHVLAASADNTVSRWNVLTGEEAGPRLPHTDRVTDLAVSSNGRLALTITLRATNETAYDSEISVWDLEAAEVKTAIRVPNEFVRSVDLDESGRIAITAGTSNNRLGGDIVRLWDIERGEEVTGPGNGTEAPFLDGAKRGVSIYSARFAPDAGRIVTVGGNNARLWEQATGREIMVYSPHRAVANAAFSTKGAFVVTGSWDGSAKVWDVSTGRDIARLAGGHEGPVTAAMFMPGEEERLLTAGADGRVTVWNWSAESTGTALLKQIEAHRGPINTIAFDGKGTVFVTASRDGTCRIWNAQDFSVPAIDLEHGSPVTAVAVSEDGEWVVSGTENRVVRLWNARDGREIQLPREIRGHSAAVTSVAVSADRRRILSASLDGTAKIWDSESGNELLTLRGHDAEISSVRLSPTGHDVLTSGYDGTAILWNALHLGPAVRIGSEPMTFVVGQETTAVPIAPRGTIEDPTRSNWSGASLVVSIDPDPVDAANSSEGETTFSLALDAEGKTFFFEKDQLLQRRSAGDVAIASAERSATSIKIQFTADCDRHLVRDVLRSIMLEANSGIESDGRWQLKVQLATERDASPVAVVREVIAVDSSLDAVTSILGSERW